MNPIYGETLYHYGIRGQKWGKRRFQNKDGSLMPAGLKRFYAARAAKGITAPISEGTRFSKKTIKKMIKKGGKILKAQKKAAAEEANRIAEEDRLYGASADGMREQTENLQKHSRINEHYESAVKAHMKEDSRYQEYRERAIEDYINSHLSSYDGNRQDMIDKMGDIDDYAMKLYMRDHKNDYFVKGYHATIGNKRTAEREFKKKAIEVAYPHESQEKSKRERELASIEKQRETIQGLRNRLSTSKLSVSQKLSLKNKITKLSNKLKKQTEAIRKRNTAKVGQTNETYVDKISEAAKRRYFR